VDLEEGAQLPPDTHDGQFYCNM